MRHIVTGYHGTDAASAASIVRGGFRASGHGWFGSAIYFWEQDKGRALRWAKSVRKSVKPAVIQAEIDLSSGVLDLTIGEVVADYRDFVLSMAERFPAEYDEALEFADQNDGFADSVWIELFRRMLAASSEPEDVDSVRAFVLEARDYQRLRVATAVTVRHGPRTMARSRVVTRIAIMVAVYDHSRISQIQAVAI